MIVGFDDELVSDVDVPVAFGATPAYVRGDYADSPHQALKSYKGPSANPLFGWNPKPHALPESPQASLYRFDLMQNPVSNEPGKGFFSWGVQENWASVRGMSIGLTILQPNWSTDSIWIPTTSTLYVVAKGTGEFSILSQPTQQEPKIHYRSKRILYPGDMVFVPEGVMHVFVAAGDSELQVVSFYDRPDPRSPITLSSFALYDSDFRQATLEQYGSRRCSAPIYVDAQPSLRLLQNHFQFVQRKP